MFGASALMIGTVAPLVATVSPTFRFASGTSFTQTTGTSECSVTGGVPPYSYSWVRVSGDRTITPTAPNAYFTAFTSSVAEGVSEVAHFQCVVTDASGQTATSNDVTVHLQRGYSPHANVSPTTLTATQDSQTIFTTSATCTVTGGLAPFTYKWTRLTGDSFIAIMSPTSPSTMFRKLNMNPGDTSEGLFWCRVTDAAGNTDQSGFVTVTFNRPA